MEAEGNMTQCVAIVPGCEECDQQARGPHVCGDLCDLDGELKRANEEYHQWQHRPLLCERCGGPLDDRQGHENIAEVPCPTGLCMELRCAFCGDVWASEGPVDCASCGSFVRSPVENLSHRQRLMRRRILMWLQSVAHDFIRKIREKMGRG